MATLSNGWYKGGIPYYEIVKVSIATMGSGIESWDGSAAQDGSILCYRSGKKVTIVCNNLTGIGDNAFFKFLALEKISGLGAVTTIGSYAFCYTPNLASIDIVPGNLTSIGASAFRMSSVEDILDLSAVSVDIIGDMATRHKRWDASVLAAVKNVVFPKTIYLDVPNAENQDNYPDVQFGTYNGEEITVATGGCSALTLYHIWNYIHNGTDKQYGDWLDWYNSTINDDGNFARNNDMSGEIYTSMITKLGWTDSGSTIIASEAQLQTIIDRLALGYPTQVTMHSVNTANLMHDISIIGCNAKNHKLAVIDSHVVGTLGTVSWLAFEDIFVGGNNESDRMRAIGYNLPVLAPNSTWFTQGGTSINKTDITEVVIRDTHTPPTNTTVSWDASAAKDGSIMCYVEDTKLTLAGNGHGKISLNEDGSNIFNGFNKLVKVDGGNYLDTSRAITFERMFQMCFVLETVDVDTWNISNVTSLKAMFQGCGKIGKLDVSKWNTSNVTDISLFLNMGSDTYRNTSLVVLDVSNWDVSKVTTMKQFVNILYGLTTLDVSNWDTSACTDMKGMFNACKNLTTLDVSNWDTSVCTNMENIFRNCVRIIELDFSKWNTSKVTTFTGILESAHSLNKLTLGSDFIGNDTLSFPSTQPYYTPGADGNWYDVNGNAIAPDAIPSGTFGVYYATAEIAEKDMSQMVLVKKGILMKTAAAIRTKNGSATGYEPSEFADAILSS